MPDTTIDITSTVVAAPEHLTADLDDEAVVLGLERGHYVGLNEVGATVWSMLQSPRRVGDICDAIVREYDVDPPTCEADLLNLLRRMASEGMIEVDA